MARSKRVKRSGEQTPYDSTADRISNLPWNVLHLIFSYLSVLDAVRTSVLSKNWKNKWLTLSTFVLDSNTIALGQNTENYRWDMVAKTVNKYLLNHTGPIKEFSVATNFSAHSQDLYHWIKYLSEKNVEVLSLQENVVVGYEVPSPLFSFRKLNKLLLGGCIIRIPSDFGGFTSLRTIYLTYIAASNDDLYRLIVSCPILENLTLLNIHVAKILRISGPRLSRLFVDTSVEDIVIENAPCLAAVAVIDVPRQPEDTVIFNVQGVIRRLFGPGSIKELVISGDMIKLLAVHYEDGNFPWKNSTMTCLTFHGLSFETVEEFHVCLALLDCCPNVKTFCFTFKSAKGQKLISKFLMKLRGKFSFLELTSLEMMSLGGVPLGCTMNFIAFLSARAPNLKFLTVWKQGGSVMNKNQVSRLVTRLKIPCPKAVVRVVQCG